MEQHSLYNAFGRVREEIARVVVGQPVLVERILIGLLCEGHILLEGLPGLAKTLTIRTVSDTLHVQFKRIQFTPDLLPSDLIGTTIYQQNTGQFVPKKGPIFSNIVLADEINRAPAKVQSALLEAMAEKQVTIGDETFLLDEPFIVLATQNPLEQEGTYPLPEAQLDRFMFKVLVDYPSLDEESKILDRMAAGIAPRAKAVLDPAELFAAKKRLNEIYMDEKVKHYILNLIQASRFPEHYGISKLKGMIRVGGSPRATLCLYRACKAKAFLMGRDFVSPDDVKELAHDVLRHRLIPTFDAEANSMTIEHMVDELLRGVAVP